MLDLLNNKYCNHEIVEEVLTIEGVSPNFFSVLEYPTDRSASGIEIRNWTTTEGLTDYSYTLNGFTNWSLDATRDNIINFNTDGLCTYGFIDGSTHIYPQPTYIIDYRTTIANCPKCIGTGVNYDIKFDETGALETVSGNTKLRQEITKALLTVQESNPFHEDYGSTINESVGQKYTTYTQLGLLNSIQTALDYLIEEQRRNEDLPLDEVLLRVEDVSVEQDSAEPRQINVVVTVTAGNYEEVKAGVKLILGG